MPLASVQVIAAGVGAPDDGNDDDEGNDASDGGEPRVLEDGGHRQAQDSAEEGRQLRSRGGFDVDDALQGFDDDEVGDEQAEMEAEIELPAECTAGGSEQRPVEGAQDGGQAAHGREQEASNRRPRRQVAQSWPPVDEINRLTAEMPGLFEIEAFDKHTRGCLFGEDFENWTDLSETCGLAMADPRMAVLRDIAANNPRVAVPGPGQAAKERTGGQAADAVRAELEGAMCRPASPNASDGASSGGSEAGGANAVYVCPICTIPMGTRRSLQSHLPTCVKAKGTLTATQRQGLLKLDLCECNICNRFFAGKSLRTHKRKCAAEHPDHRGPAAGGQSLWGEQSDIPPEVKDLLNEETTALMEEVTWEKLGRYRYASQTLTVPYACRADWRSAFQLPTICGKKGMWRIR